MYDQGQSYSVFSSPFGLYSARPPEWLTRPMEKKPVNLAVLFADITGSTRLYEKLGNARALECVGLCLNIMRESALGCSGRVVQTIGDEVLCGFPTALAGTQPAIEMQSRAEMQQAVSA